MCDIVDLASPCEWFSKKHNDVATVGGIIRPHCKMSTPRTIPVSFSLWLFDSNMTGLVQHECS